MDRRDQYLLLIDSSAESYAATEACAELAARTKAAVTALHVVNTGLVRQLLEFATPGLVGSGPYLAAYHDTCATMRNLADIIVEAYQTKFPSLLGHSDAVRIEEGNPAEVVQGLYADYDLIVMGHRTLSRKGRYSERNSLCQALCVEGARPVLVVQREVPFWSRLQLVVGDQLPQDVATHELLGLSNAARLRPEFAWIGTNQAFDQLAPVIAEKVPPAKEDFVQLTDVGHPVLDWRPLLAASEEVLPVLFTRKVLGGRSTLQGDDVSNLLLDLPVPAALFWPSEFVGRSITQPPVAASRAG